MRPRHPHAAESGVGKHTARESERVQACAAGKERVTSAHPHKLAPEASKTSGAFFVFSARAHHGRRRLWAHGTHGIHRKKTRDAKLLRCAPGITCSGVPTAGFALRAPRNT